MFGSLDVLLNTSLLLWAAVYILHHINVHFISFTFHTISSDCLYNNKLLSVVGIFQKVIKNNCSLILHAFTSFSPQLCMCLSFAKLHIKFLIEHILANCHCALIIYFPTLVLIDWLLGDEPVVSSFGIIAWFDDWSFEWVWNIVT